LALPGAVVAQENLGMETTQRTRHVEVRAATFARWLSSTTTGSAWKDS